MHSLLLKLAEIGINATVCILGFLIAGVTIFGSLTKPELLLTMLAFYREEERAVLPEIQLLHSHPYLIYFLVFAAFQLCVIVIGQRDGPVSVFVKWWPYLQPYVDPAVRITFVASAVLWTVSFPGTQIIRVQCPPLRVHHDQVARPWNITKHY